MNNKLVILIRKIVKEEVRKIIKPLVNEVLAEQFILTLVENKTRKSLIEAVKPAKEPIIERQRQQEKERIRKNLIEKVAGDDPMQQLIYGDVEVVSGISNTTNTIGHIDDDDEGVDISRFGY